MPTPIQHLTLAEEMLRGGDLPAAVHCVLSEQRGSFLLGHTAPDVQTVSGQSREETHFYAIPRIPPPAPPLPGEGGIPAHETMFAAHPALAHAEALPPAQAAFVAGYIAHLLLDKLWLERIFWRYFVGRQWGDRRERHFLHNVLRTWMDRQDLQWLDGSMVVALQETKPQGWLPFASDEHLCLWRDWLTGQLGPGRRVETAEIFARRMGVAAEEIEGVLKSSQQMEERVFRHIPYSALQSFHDTGYAQSIALIARYIGKEPPN